jgi:hypothetical protein
MWGFPIGMGDVLSLDAVAVDHRDLVVPGGVGIRVKPNRYPRQSHRVLIGLESPD